VQITGVVEDGSGTNSRTVDPASLVALGYHPHPGTLNVRVTPSSRAKVMSLTGQRIHEITYWTARLDGTDCHVRVSRDPRTLEIVHPDRLRDRLVNGDKVRLTVTGRKHMRLSAAIMAHPVRTQAAEELQASLDRPVPIIYDTNPVPSSDRAQRWATGRRAWEAADPRADWHLVLQDDCYVSQDLLAGLEQALTVLGSQGLVSAYTGTGRPDQRAAIRAIDHATKHGHSWMSLRSLYWGPAIIAPTPTVESMLDWCQDRAARTNYDRNIGLYYRDEVGWRTWYTLPSLVEHRGLPSLIGHDRGQVRVAHRFHAGPATGVDWERVPQSGLCVGA